ncbi:chemotaxis protein CheA [Salidesulfovibrio brasiliensis]|uniref:chemotaxis protein CheA n=1 Tax=Salidesulfovibrio brasiliensis TaxID=221711 RepID=UPI0006D061DC|nr:chemotaxis protein CheA [Salidesulfovibrio brasiliensis]
MSDDLNRQIFKEEAYDLLGELEGALLELDETPEDMDLVNRVFRALHTIKGSGSMFGFEDIAEFTHEVETVLDLVRGEEMAVSKDLVNLVFRARDQIQKMLDNADAGEIVDPQEMESILSGLQALVAGEPVPGAESEPAEPDASGEMAAVEDAASESSVEETVPVEAEGAEQEPNHFLIQVGCRDPEACDEEALGAVYEELAKLGEMVIQTRPGDVPGVHGWEIRLDTDKGEDHIQDIFLFADSEIDLQVTRYDTVDDMPSGPAPATGLSAEEEPEDAVQKEAAQEDADDDDGEEYEDAPKLGEILVGEGAVKAEDVEQALASQKPLGALLKEAGKVSDEQVSKAVKRQEKVRESAATKKRQEALSSIRVTAEKLDYLVDLVGELVIVQAQIAQVVSERSDTQLQTLSEELERLSDELRDSTLGIRMLPIGTTFSKFRRLVRDLSSELGKEITLSTNGAETELDKTVIERLNDPLVHLLRNSIDHGIEQPSDREAVGKPKGGMILLSAEHSGGEVLIRITDDGRGMDPDTIKAKAVEKELITADADLTRKEIFKLIFEPGFSTAKQVTNVSGRGVGMDVVKRAIDSLRGTIDIDSQKGKGTTITIRLPLTLAIIDGLQVRVEDEYYVIPLSLVEECVELSNVDRDDDESGQRIMHLRGEIVPYVYLRDFFEVEGTNPPIEQIVITGVEGSRIGIVVDTVIGEHQTVIKSLSRVYKDVEGISGATIKGDGSIALILDIPRLVRRIVADTSLN